MSLLEAGLVVSHPCVVVEVACGTPPRRGEVVAMLPELESAPVATTAEVLELLRQRTLFGRGCGFVDIGLLASALLDARTKLWTWDQRLAAVAAEIGRAYQPTLAS
ncbi:VapC toxin family PIN domain ribonuclease [Ramlibacter sp. AN1133]|uniref:VapC toxin family PIN domain ribonuclease n=1 Tax=Ramlibacter sp. AN1133 TaxID=3133429 RepID=UPI0030BECAE6